MLRNVSNFLCPILYTPQQDGHVHITSLHPLDTVEPLNNDGHLSFDRHFSIWALYQMFYCSFTKSWQHSATATGGDQFVIQVISSER